MLCIPSSNINSSDFECTWIRTIPNGHVLALYGVVIPMFALFGCFANALNAIVFMRPKMTPSVFTYLCVLSWVDSLCCIIIVCTCISRTVGLNSYNWTYFDLHLQTPLFGTLSGAANWILAAVTVDRIVYLCHRLPQTQPKFCTRPVARLNVCGIILMSIILNGPYYFMFKMDRGGGFYRTNFYKSKFYKIHNWFSFIVLGVVPGIFLLIGNTAVIVIFRRWVRQCTLMYSSNRKSNPARRNRQEHQLKLTITIIIVVFLYVFGELPGHITSRKNAINIIFGGDATKINFEKVEFYESFFLTLNVIQLSFNIIVYAVINPCFMEEFFVFLRKCSDICCCQLEINNRWKCCKKKKDSQNENAVSIFQCNDILTVELGNHKIFTIETIAEKRKVKSCFDLRLLGLRYESEEWLGCKRILQRHSLSF